MSAKRITRRGLLKAGGATLGGSILLGAGLIALGETTTVAQGGHWELPFGSPEYLAARMEAGKFRTRALAIWQRSIG